MKLITGCIMLLMSQLAIGHPVSISWVTGKIEGDKMMVTYKILAEDLIYYHKPDHDENYDYDSDVLRDLALKHGAILAQYFEVKSQSGSNLIPRIISTTHHEIVDQKVNVMDLMKINIYYRIEFKLPSTDWEQLTFYQHLAEHPAGIPSITFLSVFEEGKSLGENLELALEQPITIKKGQEKRPLKAAELTSSYFTITPKNIRHELTIPAETFRALLSQSQVTNGSMASRAQDYFNSQNPVMSNSSKLNPKLANITSLTDDESGNGFMYFDIVYPNPNRTDWIELTWDDFNWKFNWFDSQIMAIDTLYKHTFSRYQPSIRIKPNLKIDINKN